jgi:hypothetical protein
MLILCLLLLLLLLRCKRSSSVGRVPDARD